MCWKRRSFPFFENIFFINSKFSTFVSRCTSASSLWIFAQSFRQFLLIFFALNHYLHFSLGNDFISSLIMGNLLATFPRYRFFTEANFQCSAFFFSSFLSTLLTNFALGIVSVSSAKEGTYIYTICMYVCASTFMCVQNMITVAIHVLIEGGGRACWLKLGGWLVLQLNGKLLGCFEAFKRLTIDYCSRLNSFVKVGHIALKYFSSVCLLEYLILRILFTINRFDCTGNVCAWQPKSLFLSVLCLLLLLPFFVALKQQFKLLYFMGCKHKFV